LITHISPLGSMDMLSQLEVDMLKRTASSDLYQLFRNCSLAVLNSGSLTDNSKELLSRFESFDINVLRRERGVKLELINPPEDAFVDGRIIRALQANLFAVLRDILFVNGQIHSAGRFQHLDLESSIHITNLVFSILRNARALHVGEAPNMVVCWGGHSINETEYLYARRVGTQLGLRELNICTGCGPGAMEAPMKGAAVGHAQQRYKEGRFIGMTEPSIIAAEPPNPLVNELVIMPDIEKRLEAFVRIPGRRRYGRRAVVFAGHSDESGQPGSGVTADPHRTKTERRLLPRARRVYCEYAGRRRASLLPRDYR